MNFKKDQEDRLNRISTLDALLNKLTLFFSKRISDTITRDEIFYALYLTYHNIWYLYYYFYYLILRSNTRWCNLCNLIKFFSWLNLS